MVEEVMDRKAKKEDAEETISESEAVEKINSAVSHMHLAAVNEQYRDVKKIVAHEFVKPYQQLQASGYPLAHDYNLVQSKFHRLAALPSPERTKHIRDAERIMEERLGLHIDREKRG